MFRKLKICVVVPSYQEEKHIGRVIKTMPHLVDHIVVVDDYSTDKTSEKALNVNDSRVILIRHNKNQGVGRSIVTGHREAIQLKADISVVMAGDAQMNPDYLVDLLSPIIDENYDYAKGSRFLNKDHRSNMPKIRIIGTVLLTFVTKVLSGYWNLTDSQNGYTAIRTKILRKIDLDNLSKGYQFENDMILALSKLNAKIKDVAIPCIYEGNLSKIELRTFIPETLRFLFDCFIN